MGKLLKYGWPVVPAFIIDALQVLITLGISSIAAAPGTTIGGLLGCTVGEHVAGELGCTVGGISLAILGTNLNVAAPYIIPLGIAVSMAITISISFTGGALIILFLALNRSFYWKPAFWLVAEVLPGVSVGPVLTVFAARCTFRKIREELGGAEAKEFGGFIFARAQEFERETRSLIEPLAPQRAAVIWPWDLRSQEHEVAKREEAEMAASYRNTRPNRPILADIRPSV